LEKVPQCAACVEGKRGSRKSSGKGGKKSKGDGGTQIELSFSGPEEPPQPQPEPEPELDPCGVSACSLITEFQPSSG